MAYCVYCGATDEKKKIFDVISKDGITPVCEDCVYKADLPIIRKPVIQEPSNKMPNVRERLSVMAGIKKDEKRDTEVKIPSLEETKLKRMVEKNIKIGAKTKKIQPEDLVDNYHWVLMRERRSRKLSAKQVAETIGEQEMTIKMAEEGILPLDYYNLIAKFEGLYRVKLRQKTDSQDLFIDTNQKNLPRFLDLSKPENLKNLTIDDLRKIKQMREKNKSSETPDNEEEVPEEKETKKKGIFSWFKRKKQEGKEEENEETLEEEIEESEEKKKD
ncbi:MAG: hypothetical protein Q7R52_00650 [archaeon]|nr:hypothetical protein [archaeon]